VVGPDALINMVTSPKKYTQNSNWSQGTFQSSIHKSELIENRGNEIILPKNRCVMAGTCVPFIVVSDRTQTHTDRSYKNIEIKVSLGERKIQDATR